MNELSPKSHVTQTRNHSNTLSIGVWIIQDKTEDQEQSEPEMLLLLLFRNLNEGVKNYFLFSGEKIPSK